MRVCADYSNRVDDYLKQTDYPLPAAEGIFVELNRGRIFSRLGLSVAYLQIPVEEKCAEILTINTRKGLFEFLRLPFGIKLSPAIFQQVMDIKLSRQEFANLDDKSIKNKTWDQHARHVKEVFKKEMNEFGFKLSVIY